MQESISSESAHRQGYQKLDEVLVEHPLHDGDHKHSKDTTKRDQKNGARGSKPGLIVMDVVVFCVGKAVRV